MSGKKRLFPDDWYCLHADVLEHEQRNDFEEWPRDRGQLVINLNRKIGNCILCGTEIYMFDNHSLYLSDVCSGYMCEKHDKMSLQEMHEALAEKCRKEKQDEH